MAINKVLIIEGSNRTNGYTKKLTNYFNERISCKEIIVFDTYKEQFSFCDGCNFCEKNEKCKFDDLNDFFRNFEEVDLIVFSSPVYNGTFSAPVKALIDRFQPYYTSFYKHNKKQKIIKRRKAILLTASGRDGKKSLEYMETQLKFACSVLNIQYIGASLCSNTDTYPKLDEAKKQINELTERIEQLEKVI